MSALILSLLAQNGLFHISTNIHTPPVDDTEILHFTVITEYIRHQNMPIKEQ